MDAQSHLPADPNAGTASHARTAVRFVLRILKLIVIAVVAMVLLLCGLVWLIDGISDARPLSIIAGVVALGLIATGLLYVMIRSHREVRATVAEYEAKLQAGIRTCRACQIDFDEATAPRTPKPWYYTAAGIVLSLAAIGAGAVFLWALGTSRPDQSYKAGLILLAGIGGLYYSIRSSRDLCVRCPRCGRICGSIEPSARGFPVQPARPGNGQQIGKVNP